MHLQCFCLSVCVMWHHHNIVVRSISIVLNWEVMVGLEVSLTAVCLLKFTSQKVIKKTNIM